MKSLWRDVLVPRKSVKKPRVKGSAQQQAQGLDSPIDNLWKCLANDTELHHHYGKDLNRLPIDAYCMHVEDVCNVEGEAEEDSIYAGAPNGLRRFKRFLDDVEECRGLMPSWWNREKMTACERLGMDASQWCNLRQAVEKSDIIDHYGDPRFPMQLRFFAEAVFGEGPGGADGTAMRAMMVMMEQGSGGSGLQASAIDATTGNMFHMRP